MMAVAMVELLLTIAIPFHAAAREKANRIPHIAFLFELFFLHFFFVENS